MVVSIKMVGNRIMSLTRMFVVLILLSELMKDCVASSSSSSVSNKSHEQSSSLLLLNDHNNIINNNNNLDTVPDDEGTIKENNAGSVVVTNRYPLSLQHGHNNHTTFNISQIKNLFLLNYTNFNHGSFGSCPRFVLEYQQFLRQQQEQQPDIFIRQTYRRLWNDTRYNVAQQTLSTNYQNLVLLESASTAVNSIVRSMDYTAGDIIIYFSTAYGMVKNTAQWLKRHYNITIVEIPIIFPIKDKNVYIVALQQTLDDLKHNQTLDNVKVIVLDHMVSIPAIKLPIIEMTTLIRKQYNNTYCGQNDTNKSPFILVDGAHAWGQIPNIEISNLVQSRIQNDDNDSTNVWIDAYLSNGHKWMYSPKGSAILWIHPSRITKTFPEPTVISSANTINDDEYSNLDNVGDNIDDLDDPLYHRYVYTSTKDYTAMVSIQKAIEFRNHILGGDDVIYKYIRNLAMNAKLYLMTLWQTPVMITPNNMEEYMINIILPISRSNENKTQIATTLQRWLYEQHNMYVVIAKEPTSGYIYTRLSSQIYLTMKDFQRLGHAVLEFLNHANYTVGA